MSKVHSMHKRKLPSTGKPGDLYYAVDSEITYLALADGRLFPIDGLLSANPGRGVGPQGEPGRDGRNGVDGINGRNGEDGRPGAKGESGDVTIVGDAELQAAVVVLRKKLATAHAAILQAMVDNEKAPRYIRDQVRLRLAALKVNAGL